MKKFFIKFCLEFLAKFINIVNDIFPSPKWRNKGKNKCRHQFFLLMPLKDDI